MNQLFRELIELRVSELKIRLAYTRQQFLSHPDRKEILQLEAQISAFEWVLREGQYYECA